jgi:large subunit ribosomal protein L2
MGKNLIQQRRGKGSSTFRAPSFRYIGKVSHTKISEQGIKGKIVDIIKCPGHSAPLIDVKYDNGERVLNLAPEGVRVGEAVESGPSGDIKNGSTLPLKSIPEGTAIYNIESRPGDGGKFVRCSGTFAKIVGKSSAGITIKLPSNKQKTFSPECRACIGIIAAGGKRDKPLLKAGNHYHARKAKNKYWPITSGSSMNAVAHPFGGKGSHTKGRPHQAPRSAPPGRKVGSIAPRRSGYKR